MATTKTTRMDAQGRVILPPHIRKEMNLNPGQLLSVSLEGNTITVRPAEERCAFCGESVEGKHHAVVTIGRETKNVCAFCAETVAKAQIK